MNIVKEGSCWWGGDSKKFIVLAVIEQEGNTWVHYRDDGNESPKEYSCYLESFLSRFIEVPK